MLDGACWRGIFCQGMIIVALLGFNEILISPFVTNLSKIARKKAS